MPADVAHSPFTADQVIPIALVGCGGTGARLLEGLCQMHTTLHALGWQGLAITVVDPDVVNHINLVRGPFYPCDVGFAKSVVLANRANLLLGQRVAAVVGTLEQPSNLRAALVIDATDNAAARRGIHAYLKSRKSLLLHCGNGRDHGQVILGGPTPNGVLRGAYQMHGDLLEDNPLDDTPSCSAVESLTKQDAFINQLMAGVALNMLWQLVYHQALRFNVAVINSATGVVATSLEWDG